MYLVFPTEQDAEAAQAAYWESVSFDDLSRVTQRWAVPTPCAEGWAIPTPPTGEWGGTPIESPTFPQGGDY